jgi:hypothetical protein
MVGPENAGQIGLIGRPPRQQIRTPDQGLTLVETKRRRGDGPTKIMDHRDLADTQRLFSVKHLFSSMRIL